MAAHLVVLPPRHLLLLAPPDNVLAIDESFKPTHRCLLNQREDVLCLLWQVEEVPCLLRQWKTYLAFYGKWKTCLACYGKWKTCLACYGKWKTCLACYGKWKTCLAFYGKWKTFRGGGRGERASFLLDGLLVPARGSAARGGLARIPPPLY